MRGYGTALYQHCRNMLRDPALADDVHQQSFVQAYEDFPRYSGRSSLKTWLFGIAHHRCLDALRAQRRLDGRSTSEDVLAGLEDPDPLPEARIAEGFVQRTVAQCLEKLAPATRLAVRLRFTEDFSYEQMAAICGEKAGTLQARVARALPAIRKCLQSGGIAP